MSSEYDDTLRLLCGAWRLVSSEFRTPSGSVIHPLGEDAQGQATFTDSCHLSAHVMRSNRPEFASGNQSTGTDEETREALAGYVAYYGPCEIDVEKKTLTTHVEGSLFPNWIGHDQLRFYEVADDQLILRTPPIAMGDEEFTGVLTWARI